LSTSVERHGSLYQCSICGNLFEIIEGNRGYFSISHPDAREFYNIMGNMRYLNEVDLQRLKILHKDLNSILYTELKLGNSVFETSEGWPSKDSILVILSKPFHKKYNFASCAYNELNDPHYWKAQYQGDAPKHILACKF